MIRRGEPADLAAVAAIQRETPQASQWDFAGYLQMDFWVADAETAWRDSWWPAPWPLANGNCSTWR